MRATHSRLVLALAALLCAHALAQAPVAQPASPPAPTSLCALPFVGEAPGMPDLGYRFWVGLVEQLAAQPGIELTRNGALARAAQALAKPASAITDEDLPAVAKALGAATLVGGRITVEEGGVVVAVGYAWRASDASIQRTPRYRVAAGEESKATREMAAYMVRFLTSGAPAQIAERAGSDETRVAAIARALDLAIPASLTGQPAPGLDEAIPAVSAYLDSGPGDLAVPALEDILRGVRALRPTSVGAVVQLGRLHLLRGAPSDANAAFRVAVEASGNAAEAYDLCAYACLRANQPDLALSYAQAGVAAFPTHASLNNTLGRVLLEKKLTAEAEAAFRKAAEADPTGATGVSARLNLAVLQLSAGQIDECIATLDAAIAVSPDNADLHYNRGLALHVLARRENSAEKYALARTAYEKAVSCDLSHAKAHCNLGVVLEVAGDADGAMAEYRKALDLDTNFVTAGKNLAYALEKKQQNAEAAALWRKIAVMRGVTADEAAKALDRATKLGG